MHSSRMRTARLLSVSPSMYRGRKLVPGLRGCTWSRGVYLVLGVYLVPKGTGAPPPVKRMYQKPVKI